MDEYFNHFRNKSNPFVKSLSNSIKKWGYLTANQERALEKLYKESLSIEKLFQQVPDRVKHLLIYESLLSQYTAQGSLSEKQIEVLKNLISQ